MNEHVDYQAQTPSAITKFFWWCAGADKQILKYSSYSDHVKYFGIGGVVFATAVLAFLSMGFAMHIIFNGNWYVTIPVSIVWALIILNLDRFIVSSTGKGDGNETMGLMELVNALPRLGMAVLIGFCISAPLETYIFQTEIQREWQLSMDQLAMSKSFEVLATELQRDSQIIQKVKVLEEDFSKQQEIVLKWQKAFEEETSGLGGRGSRGYGPEAKKMEEKMKDEENALKRIQASRDSLRNKLENNEKGIKDKQEKVMEDIKKTKPGFLDQIMMLERLSSQGKTVPKFDPATGQIVKGKEVEIFGAAFWPIWLVRLLFMMLEIAPVLLKLMLIKGPYDYMSENINQILESKQGISIEHIRNEHNKITKFKTNHNPLRIIKIVERQNQRETENAIEAIDSFAEKEKKDIQENPEKYIKDNDVDKV